MAETEGLTSNAIFEELADWEAQLQYLDFSDLQEVGDEFDEPQP